MYLDGLDGLDQKIVGLLIENARIPILILERRSVSQGLR